MKVAVATDNEMVSAHFGHAPGFTLAEVCSDGITEKKYIDNPGGDCKAIPAMLAGMGVETVIVGGIGGGAVSNLQNSGIDVIGGAAGSVDSVLEAFLAGSIERGELGCSHKDHEGCGHHG